MSGPVEVDDVDPADSSDVVSLASVVAGPEDSRDPVVVMGLGSVSETKLDVLELDPSPVLDAWVFSDSGVGGTAHPPTSSAVRLAVWNGRFWKVHVVMAVARNKRPVLYYRHRANGWFYPGESLHFLRELNDDEALVYVGRFRPHSLCGWRQLPAFERWP